jgi:hypothetical protein
MASCSGGRHTRRCASACIAVALVASSIAAAAQDRDREERRAGAAGPAASHDRDHAGELRERPLDDFAERYLQPRGLSIKQPFAMPRLSANALPQQPGRLHRTAEWRLGPAPVAAPATGARECAWSSVGPTNINGRVTGIAVDPSNGQRIYVSTVGGIWRSVDGARRWERVSDDFASTVFASVAVNPATPTEVFAGGGDPNLHGAWRGSLGILRSTSSGDAGSWSQVSPPELDGSIVYRIVVGPAPSHNVYAATNLGVYIGTRTQAGISFAPLAGFDAWTTDIAVDSSATPALVYAGVRQATTKFGRGIWKFDGTSWTDRTAGIPTTHSRTITLALAPSSPGTLYAKVEADTGALQGLYKTTTAAESAGTDAWVTLPGGSKLNDSCAGSCYSGYNTALAADPANANVVWGGALEIYRTLNGGVKWTVESTGSDPDMPLRVHVDHHAIAFDPVNSKIVYVGNDGGLWKSSDTSLATWHWTNVSHGMILTEFYRASSQQALANLMAGGTQDNGTVLSFGNRTWYQPVFDCDGADVAIDAANASTVYANCDGALFELPNPVRGTPGSDSTIPWTRVPETVAIAPPLVTDDTVPGAALAGAWTPQGDGTIAWQVAKTKDGVTWQVASPSLGAPVTAIGIAPSDAFKTYYVGTKVGEVWRTTSAGAAWTTPPSTVVPGAPVNALYVDAGSPARTLASTPAGLFLTVDTGATWTPLEDTALPPSAQRAVTGAVFDPSVPNVAYAVTPVGAFRVTITPAAGASPATAAWEPFDDGLPHALDINDVWVNRATKMLRIGTVGYGAYRRDIRPGAMCRDVQLLVRDNIYDDGTRPWVSGVPDPEHPIPDTSRPQPQFYKPDDTAAGLVYWWQSTDIRIDVPSSAPSQNRLSSADHVEAQSCPIHLSSCPPGTIRDAEPQPGQPARLYVNVSNTGLRAASDVRVTALVSAAGTTFPSLPNDFWTTTFPAGTTACGALDTSTGWQFADSARPCRVIPVVNPHLPEVVGFDWTGARPSAILVVVESADDPLDASIRSGNTTDVSRLAPNDRHVSVRNLHVIDGAPVVAGGMASLLEPMHISNPGDAKRVELLVSRAGLPADATLDLLLPRATHVLPIGAQPLDLKSPRFGVRLSPQDLERAGLLGPDLPTAYRIPGREASFLVDMPPNGSLVVAWHHGATGSGPGRWAVVERVGERIVGGSTYFVRTPAVQGRPARASEAPSSKPTPSR